MEILLDQFRRGLNRDTTRCRTHASTLAVHMDFQGHRHLKHHLMSRNSFSPPPAWWLTPMRRWLLCWTWALTSTWTTDVSVCWMTAELHQVFSAARMVLCLTATVLLRPVILPAGWTTVRPLSGRRAVSSRALWSALRQAFTTTPESAGKEDKGTRYGEASKVIKMPDPHGSDLGDVETDQARWSEFALGFLRRLWTMWRPTLRQR